MTDEKFPQPDDIPDEQPSEPIEEPADSEVDEDDASTSPEVPTEGDST